MLRFAALGLLALCWPSTIADQPVPRSGVAHHTAQEVIQKLDLIPSDEKGYFLQTFQDPATVHNRSVSTAIYYLLEGAESPSLWHRIDATEVWHYYAGAALTLYLTTGDGKPVTEHVLGPEIFEGQRPQVVINASEWQMARSWGDWTLVGTTVAPGFEASKFELPPPGWTP